VAIQKVWRGYQTRNLDPVVVRLKNHMRLSRAEEHVEHLMSRQQPAKTSASPSVSNGLTAKTRVVASAAIRPGESWEELVKLRHSHQLLERQVNDLQQSMQQVLDWMSSSSIPSFQQPVPRPSTLPLTSKSAPSVQQPVECFAQGMADRLIQSVSDPSLLEPPPSNNNNNMSTSTSSTVVGLVP
jgi:hypothetical protein